MPWRKLLPTQTEALSCWNWLEKLQCGVGGVLDTRSGPYLGVWSSHSQGCPLLHKQEHFLAAVGLASWLELTAVGRAAVITADDNSRLLQLSNRVTPGWINSSHIIDVREYIVRTLPAT